MASRLTRSVTRALDAAEAGTAHLLASMPVTVADIGPLRSRSTTFKKH